MANEPYDALAPVSIPPEAVPAFRRGQLLVMLGQFEGPVELDRIGYIEFFAANPYLVLRKDSPERTSLLLAGFNPKALSYQATTERYANRRTRLRSDLGALVAWKYARTSTVDGLIACELTSEGHEEADKLITLYADAYRLSVSLIRKEIKGLSNRALALKVQGWLRIDDLRIDLLDREFEFNTDLQGVLL
jgi:hypothetical protein